MKFRKIIMIVVSMIFLLLATGCGSDDGSVPTNNNQNSTQDTGTTPAVTILSSFTAPSGTQPAGLTWHNGHLWLASYILTPGIYKLDPATGNVAASYLPDIVWNNRYGGLATDGTSLYHLQANNSKSINVLDFTTLAQSTSITIQDDCTNFSDLAIQGNAIWTIGSNGSADPASFHLLKISTSDGSVLASHGVPAGTEANQNFGLAFDGTSLWVSSGNLLFKLDPTDGRILTSYDLGVLLPEAAISRLESLAWDGSHLWGASFYGGVYKFLIQE